MTTILLIITALLAIWQLFAKRYYKKQYEIGLDEYKNLCKRYNSIKNHPYDDK